MWAWVIAKCKAGIQIKDQPTALELEDHFFVLFRFGFFEDHFNIQIWLFSYSVRVLIRPLIACKQAFSDLSQYCLPW